MLINVRTTPFKFEIICENKTILKHVRV